MQLCALGKKRPMGLSSLPTRATKTKEKESFLREVGRKSKAKKTWSLIDEVIIALFICLFTLNQCFKYYTSGVRTG